MIVYSLACAGGHGFEGWFKDSAAFDTQAADGSLTCPVCQSRDIAKAPMAPAVAGTREKSAPTHADLKKMRQYFAGLRKEIEAKADNVGRAFPEEARKIHYGEAEERPIYGEASLAEARELIEEGIDVAPMPPDINEAN